MNEQFRLPAQEWLGYDPERGDIHGYTPEQMRKFSELMVKECLNIIDNSEGDLDYAIFRIEKHFFGVDYERTHQRTRS